ncbi:hypothetical protein [Profundibacter sp.]
MTALIYCGAACATDAIFHIGGWAIKALAFNNSVFHNDRFNRQSGSVKGNGATGCHPDQGADPEYPKQAAPHDFPSVV